MFVTTHAPLAILDIMDYVLNVMFHVKHVLVKELMNVYPVPMDYFYTKINA